MDNGKILEGEMNEGIPTVEVPNDLEIIDKMIEVLRIEMEKDTREIDKKIHKQALENLESQRKHLSKRNLEND